MFGVEPIKSFIRWKSEKSESQMNLPNQYQKSVGSKYDMFVLWFAMFFPTVVTYIYFNLLADSAASLQQSAYGDWQDVAVWITGGLGVVVFSAPPEL